MKDTRLRIVMKFNQFSNLYIKCKKQLVHHTQSSDFF